MDPTIMEREDRENLKRVNLLLDRIERVLVPDFAVNLYEEQFEVYKRKAAEKGYFHTITIVKKCSGYDGYYMRGVNWDQLSTDVLVAIQRVEGPDVTIFPPKVIMEFDFEIDKEAGEVERLRAKEGMAHLQRRNGQPQYPGKWRKMPYTPRSYVPLQGYVATTTIDEEEGKTLLDMLDTPRDGFLGQAYNYDDNDLTEEWMVSFKDRGSKGPTDEDVIRTNLGSLMEVMLLQVQDRVCNETGVLQRKPIGLGEKLQERPVWGIDCYTRRMVELALEDALTADTDVEMNGAGATAVAHDKHPRVKEIAVFIERYLGPAINAQEPENAHNMLFALKHLQEKPLHKNSPVFIAEFAKIVEAAVLQSGIDAFKIHPKGTGVICTSPEGIAPHVLVAEYLGEAYPAYRWCERLDVIEQAQRKLDIKPMLPEFWNILLERPRQDDPRGYGLIYVDASQKCNLGSSCSHSCDSNATSAVVARHGKLAIALTTNRAVHYGEELTMDYSSITTSETEWRAAICLCGKMDCRGSFLHYATQDDLQQVLTQNCGTLWRYASLLKACSDKPVSATDSETMAKHGMLSCAMGPTPQPWATKFAADNLRFVEFERKALPCALMRTNDERGYTFAAADMDARSVMEQRLQSMVNCFAMVDRVAAGQRGECADQRPLHPLPASEATAGVWRMLCTVPDLLTTYVLKVVSAKGFKSTVVLGVASSNGTSSSQSNGSSTVNSSSPMDTAAASPVLETQTQARTRVISALTTIKAILRGPCPSSIREVRQSIKKVRVAILSIKDLSNPMARLELLSDMLCLWGNTSFFSTINKFDTVKSAPIDVIAQDIGSTVRYRDLKQAPPQSSPITTIGTSPDSSGVTDSDGSGSSRSVSPSVGGNHTATTKRDATKEDEIVPALEVVFTGRRCYRPLFTFHTAMNWFDAGTDNPIGPPDVFGCCMLPHPQQCFGTCAAPHGYTHKVRRNFLKMVSDEKMQSKPWPAALKGCFSHMSEHAGYCQQLPQQENKAGKASGKQQQQQQQQARSHVSESDPAPSPIFGSPMLDVALGSVQAMAPVQIDLMGYAARKKLGKAGGGGDEEEDVQFDHILPPEIPTDWVQCEACHKWRRVAWHVDMSSLPDEWVCSMNSWEPTDASCDVPQDTYDPEAESTLEQRDASIKLEPLCKADVGQWRDVYCTSNQVYYEAKVMSHRVHRGREQVKFHFKGWSMKFDEWMACDSDRIRPHNLMTDPTCTDIRHQAEWQGNFKVHRTLAAAQGISPSASAAKAAAAAGTENSIGAVNKGKSTKAGLKRKGGGSSSSSSSGTKRKSTVKSTKKDTPGRKSSKASKGQAVLLSSGEESVLNSAELSSGEMMLAPQISAVPLPPVCLMGGCNSTMTMDLPELSSGTGGAGFRVMSTPAAAPGGGGELDRAPASMVRHVTMTL